jgi:hypothetical protein
MYKIELLTIFPGFQELFLPARKRATRVICGSG